MNRLIKAFLLVSVSFNVMFAIGYFCAPTPAQTPQSSEEAADLVAQKLGLDERQRETFVALRTEARERAEELGQHASLLQEELAVKANDPKAVEHLTAELADVRESYRQVQFGQFRRLMDALTPQQREAVVNRIHAWQQGRPFRGLRVLQQFDADKDGKLSPDERQKAIQTLRERWRGSPKEKAPGRLGPGPLRPGDGPRPRPPWGPPDERRRLQEPNNGKEAKPTSQVR